jgi:hypothetical protein
MKFTAVGPEKDDFDGGNLDTITQAVLGLGGQLGTGREVNFATPPAAGACTDAFLIDVPLKVKRNKLKKGVRTIRTAITAGGKVDKDKLKLICTP